jgi:hypothetical protein
MEMVLQEEPLPDIYVAFDFTILTFTFAIIACSPCIHYNCPQIHGEQPTDANGVST